MKTNEPAPAANLTVAQLGQVLSKKNTASPDPKKKSEAKPATPATSREPLPPKEGEGEEGEPTDLSHTAPEGEGNEGGAGEGQPTGEEGGEGGKAPEGEGAEGGEGGEGEATPEGGEGEGQPATISEAVLAHINQELGPLITELTKAGQKGALQILQKRIPKLVDQRDTERNGRLTAEQRVEELETELSETKAQPQASPRSSPMHPAVAAIADSLHEVDTWISRLKANPDGLEIPDGEGGTVEWTREQVSEHLDKLRDKRTELVADKRIAEQTTKANFTSAVKQLRQQIAPTYPWLTKPEAPEHGRMKKILELIPGLSDLADHELIVARYFRGMAAEKAEAAKGKAPVTRKAPPAQEPTKVATNTPASKSGPVDGLAKAKKDVADAEVQFKKSGKRTDLGRLNAARTVLQRLQPDK